MQNKGLVRMFAFLFGLVSLYQLSFTFKSNQIEKEAEQFAANKVSESIDDYSTLRNFERLNYLDSLNNIEVFDIGITSFNYKEVKEKAMNLGLDLKGGINVILQISVRDILLGLAEGSNDPSLTQALDDAEILQKDSQNTYLDDFFIAFDALKGKKTLASGDIFGNSTLEDEIPFDMKDDEVKPILSKKIDESIESAFEVLRKRIDKFGVTQPNIQRIGRSGRILVELPGAKEIERVKTLLQSTAQLEFWDTFKAGEFQSFFIQANEVLKEVVAEQAIGSDSNDVQLSKEDEISKIIGDSDAENNNSSEVNPLEDLNPIFGRPDGPILLSISAKDQQLFDDYLNNEKVRSKLPYNLKYTKFAWGIPRKSESVAEGGDLSNDQLTELVDLYALAGNPLNKPQLSGAVVTDARQTFEPNNDASVSMQMNLKGAREWEKMTGNAYKNASQIAIVLDNVVYSAPGVTSGPIEGGNSVITGDFTLEEAIDLANVLRAGKLPASADIVQAEEVGPSLGQEAIDSGMKSFLIALGFVLLWMIFYYGRAGIYSNLALLLNILLIFGILSGLGAVLTLPGIAGIVLTIGIAVDANVLIYERVREELLKGKEQKSAVRDGFSNALSSILDANITTGLTALILYTFGTGPIKGFATTLLIGILTSLFTAIFISRLQIDRNLSRGAKLNFSTKLTKGLLSSIKIKFLKKRLFAYLFSASIILTGLFSLFTTGLDQGIDFVGGRTYTVRFAKDMNTEEVKNALNSVFNSAEVKTIGSANQLKISTKYKVNENSAEVDAEVQEKLYLSLKPFLPEGTSYKQFIKAENNVGKMYSGKVSPTIADDIKTSSLWAILGSLIVVFLYILIRFKKWQFSLGAVAAVFHDVLIVLGIFSIAWKYLPFSMEIDQAFIAAILTVIGYSLNDTVVVFDRIREYINEHTSWDFMKIVDSALNSTLSRTLNTSLTTLVVLLAMFVFGADSLRGLLFALIVGVLVGTYSSVFIATPIMHDTLKRAGQKS